MMSEGGVLELVSDYLIDTFRVETSNSTGSDGNEPYCWTDDRDVNSSSIQGN